MKNINPFNHISLKQILPAFRNLYLLLAMISILIGCNGNQQNQNENQKEELNKALTKQTDLESEGLRGKVKCVTQDEYFAVKKDKVLPGVRKNENNFIAKYDLKGNKIEQSDYNADKKLIEKSKYLYDSEGNKLKKLFYDSSDQLTEQIKFKYDSQGRICESDSYNPNDILNFRALLKYNSISNDIETDMMDAKGLLMQKGKDEYDKNGFKVKTITYSETEAVTASTTYENDSSGNKKLQKYYSPEGAVNSEYAYEYEYDSIGNWVKRIECLKEKYMETESNKSLRKGAITVTIRELIYY